MKKPTEQSFCNLKSGPKIGFRKEAKIILSLTLAEYSIDLIEKEHVSGRSR